MGPIWTLDLKSKRNFFYAWNESQLIPTVRIFEIYTYANVSKSKVWKFIQLESECIIQVNILCHMNRFPPSPTIFCFDFIQLNHFSFTRQMKKVVKEGGGIGKIWLSLIKEGKQISEFCWSRGGCHTSILGDMWAAPKTFTQYFTDVFLFPDSKTQIQKKSVLFGMRQKCLDILWTLSWNIEKNWIFRHFEIVQYVPLDNLGFYSFTISFSHGHRQRRAVSFRLSLTQEE